MHEEGGPHYDGRCNEFGGNMSLCIVESDLGSVRPTEPWVLAQHTRRVALGLGAALGSGRLGALGPGSIRVLVSWPSTRGGEIAKAVTNSGKTLEAK